MGEGQWYWCLKHRQVEPYRACRSADRLGPYATADEAAGALDRVQLRNEAWETDPRWNDLDEEEGCG